MKNNECRSRVAKFAVAPMLLLLAAMCVAPVTANSVARKGHAFDGYPVFPVPDYSQTAQPRTVVERGAYLAKMADCLACHTNEAAETQAPLTVNRSGWEILLDQGKERLYEVAIRGEGSMPPKGGCAQCSQARVKAAVDYMIDKPLSAKHGEAGEPIKFDSTNAHLRMICHTPCMLDTGFHIRAEAASDSTNNAFMGKGRPMA